MADTHDSSNTLIAAASGQDPHIALAFLPKYRISAIPYREPAARHHHWLQQALSRTGALYGAHHRITAATHAMPAMTSPRR
jgi:hypothetical protein